ncbi:uncharacterized protein BP5553_02185 [Venustampulla echinocandica]|uniref:Uncharacterized protein n=1 Tax=Venustampulla echinocandica TaxID=2656787 RepID=A0A370U351_9HELO|nr:uncharacterized protein BP5553_02185 [Venustampulla echinocandica]RDL42206.1 hypothetical protein BP5553_02185 [Venustampulla echinocandica]
MYGGRRDDRDRRRESGRRSDRESLPYLPPPSMYPLQGMSSAEYREPLRYPPPPSMYSLQGMSSAQYREILDDMEQARTGQSRAGQWVNTQPGEETVRRGYAGFGGENLDRDRRGGGNDAASEHSWRSDEGTYVEEDSSSSHQEPTARQGSGYSRDSQYQTGNQPPRGWYGGRYDHMPPIRYEAATVSMRYVPEGPGGQSSRYPLDYPSSRGRSRREEEERAREMDRRFSRR